MEEGLIWVGSAVGVGVGVLTGKRANAELGVAAASKTTSSACSRVDLRCWLLMFHDLQGLHYIDPTGDSFRLFSSGSRVVRRQPCESSQASKGAQEAFNVEALLRNVSIENAPAQC